MHANVCENGQEMEIKVTYRRTSRLSMRIVKNGDVHVSAPIGMPREKVMAFIEEHKDWINEARKKTFERQKQRAEFFNKLPLATRAQADEALKRLKAQVLSTLARGPQGNSQDMPAGRGWGRVK